MSCDRHRRFSLLLPEDVIDKVYADYEQRRRSRHQPLGDFLVQTYFEVPEYLRDRILKRWQRRHKHRIRSDAEMLEIVLTHHYREME